MRALLSLFALLFAVNAYAFQNGRVATDFADLKAEPKFNSATLEKLKKGEPVTASDSPTNGFFKVRTRTGSGWVLAGSLSFSKRVEKTERAPSAPSSVPFLAVRALSGYGSFALTDLKAAMGLTNFGAGFTFGAEASVRIWRSLSAVLRWESFSQQLTGQDNTTGNTYQITFSETGLAGGLSLPVVEGRSFSISLAGLGGMVMPARFSSVATNLAAPNETTYSAQHLLAMGKAQLNWRLSRTFSAFAEAGYRYAPGSAVSPSLTGNGGTPFQSGGSYSAFAVDSSGIFGSVGLEIALLK